jgi:hypothetical protein
VDNLTHLVDLLVDPGFGLFDASLAQINCVSQDRATLLDRLRVTATLEADALAI